eukprot:CAMPEP_0174924742 /NCGR_PEP_ID=MMETSP1355-20121228/7445_1 /TAXON_ID=464990 /ORGANISM="Hemiselmis tepida, Strain CCMP443" /LENGTH=427 /DNA_ID=CAMNT_0016170575 /DNA_START=241 /DNA_END=1524 /DNA_ORIENTATION=+
MTGGQYLLALAMLVTGSINTISTKLADVQCVPASMPSTVNCDVGHAANTNSTSAGVCPSGCTTFDHPFFQAAGMFIGELLCIVAFRATLLCAASKSRDASLPDESSEDSEDAVLEDGFPPYIFALPALCDMVATSMMYLGLTMTYASVFQMLRGSVVVFTGLLSIIMLGKRLWMCHIAGMFLVTAGAFIVGLSSVLGQGGDSAGAAQPSHPMLGNILIVCAQVVVSTQMVVEEKFLSRYRVSALQAVGWEGLWGLLFLSIALTGMYFSQFGPDICDGHACIENAIQAVLQVQTSPVLTAAVLGNIFSIAFFNFFGISVTQSMSATHRMVLDSLRTMVIWVFSLVVGWQAFAPLQVVGFAVLFLGTLIYNELLIIPGIGGGAARSDLMETLVEDDEVDGLLGGQSRWQQSDGPRVNSRGGMSSDGALH